MTCATWRMMPRPVLERRTSHRKYAKCHFHQGGRMNSSIVWGVLMALLAAATATRASSEPFEYHPSHVRVYVLDGGQTFVHDKGIFGPAYAGAGPFTLEVRCFLIVH